MKVSHGYHTLFLFLGVLCIRVILNIGLIQLGFLQVEAKALTLTR